MVTNAEVRARAARRSGFRVRASRTSPPLLRSTDLPTGWRSVS